MTLTLSVKFPQIGIGIASAFDKKFGAEGTAGIKTCDPSLMLGVQRATTTVDGVINHEVTQRGRVSELFEIFKERVHRWYFSVTVSLYGSAAGERKPADEADVKHMQQDECQYIVGVLLWLARKSNALLFGPSTNYAGASRVILYHAHYLYALQSALPSALRP